MSADLALVVLRVVVGGVVMPHGLQKLGWVGTGGSITGVAGWFNGLGLKPGLFWALVATTAEALGGLLTVLGLAGPLGPAILAGDMLVVAIVAHLPQGFWVGDGKVGWEFPLPLAAAGFAIALLGNGNWSLDGAFGLTYSEQFRWVWLAIVAVGVVIALGTKLLLAPKTAAA